MTPFKVFLNREQDEHGRMVGMWDGYKPEHALELVYEGQLLNADLDLVYAMFNAGSGRFVGNDRYPHRSLSVGDVVELDGTRYSVENVGWKELS